MPYLVFPTVELKTSFLEALEEYRLEDSEHYRNLDRIWLNEMFDEYVQQLHDEARGENLPEGYLPHSEFWLVQSPSEELVEDGEYLGRLDIRHELNDHLKKVGGHIGYDIRPSQRRKGYGKLILQLGLKKARELGIEKVLVTCDVDNVGSNKIIQQNGGVLESTEPQGERLPDKCRYWITL